jgi:hypothetical protein
MSKSRNKSNEISYRESNISHHRLRCESIDENDNRGEGKCRQAARSLHVHFLESAEKVVDPRPRVSAIRHLHHVSDLSLSQVSSKY